MAQIVILTEGRSNPNDAKTASAVLRYRGEEVVGLLDSTQAGKSAGEVLGVGGDVPFIKSLREVAADTLLVGIAPVGGGLPDPWRPVLREAIERGLTIVSGLHTFIGEDPELRVLAEKRGVEIQDLRKPPPDLTVSRNVAKDTRCFRVHTVGNDCNVGKMLTSVELALGLRRRNYNAEFVATGQTGILISGWGVAVDRVISDFVPGAIEPLIVERGSADFLVIEGQGSVNHPLYSGVTLGLLHGCAPQAMVMCCEAGRSKLRHADVDLPPMDWLISMYESLASLSCPSRVVGFSVNTSYVSPDEADREVRTMEDRFGMPATDPVRFGVEKLVDAVLEASGKRASIKQEDAHKA